MAVAWHPPTPLPHPQPLADGALILSLRGGGAGRGKGSFLGFPCSAFILYLIASKDPRGRKSKRPIQQVGKGRPRSRDGAGRAPSCRVLGASWGWLSLEETKVVSATSLEFCLA